MLNIFIAAAILFTVVFSIAVGSRFSMHTRFFLNPEALHHVQVQYSNENVVKMTEVRSENNEVILSWRKTVSCIREVLAKICRLLFWNGWTRARYIAALGTM
jgi:hypothetical protein